jgi:hypothetical protein
MKRTPASSVAAVTGSRGGVAQAGREQRRHPEQPQAGGVHHAHAGHEQQAA